MKFLHTSDLHLGLRLCEYRMNVELSHLLDEIADIAIREECQAVLVSGDLYDKSTPTAESVAILDRFVSVLARHGIAFLAISGNHDSPERIAYLSDVLKTAGVHVSPAFDGSVPSVSFRDDWGEVRFHLLPFFRPSVLHLICPDFEGESMTDALRFVLSGIETDRSGGTRHVLLAHLFTVCGGTADPDAEAGGLDAVPTELFLPFDYTALGHLHRAHAVGSERIRYSGSPLKCSFAEAGEEKSVELVELGEPGSVKITPIPLHPLHDLRELRGTYDEMLSPAFRESGDCGDYLRVILTDEDDVPDAIARLRTVYPHLMRLSYDNRRTRETASFADSDLPGEDSGALTPMDVFAELYTLQNNRPPDDETLRIAAQLFEKAETEVLDA